MTLLGRTGAGRTGRVIRGRVTRERSMPRLGKAGSGQPCGQTIGGQEAVERVAVGEGKGSDTAGGFQSDGDGFANF